MKTKQCSHLQRGPQECGSSGSAGTKQNASGMKSQEEQEWWTVASHLWLRAVQGTGCTDCRVPKHRVEGTPGARPWGRRTLAAITHSADLPQGTSPLGLGRQRPALRAGSLP